jgi:hypothetical protein
MQVVEFSPKIVQLLFNREPVATIFDFRKHRAMVAYPSSDFAKALWAACQSSSLKFCQHKICKRSAERQISLKEIDEILLTLGMRLC